MLLVCCVPAHNNRLSLLLLSEEGRKSCLITPVRSLWITGRIVVDACQMVRLVTDADAN